MSIFVLPGGHDLAITMSVELRHSTSCFPAVVHPAPGSQHGTKRTRLTRRNASEPRLSRIQLHIPSNCVPPRILHPRVHTLLHRFQRALGVALPKSPRMSAHHTVNILLGNTRRNRRRVLRKLARGLCAYLLIPLQSSSPSHIPIHGHQLGHEVQYGFARPHGVSKINETPELFQIPTRWLMSNTRATSKKTQPANSPP